MKLKALLLLGILFFATEFLVEIEFSLNGGLFRLNSDDKFISYGANSTLNKSVYIGENREALKISVRDNGVISIINSETLSIKPRYVEHIETIRLGSEEGIAIFGEDYVYINGTSNMHTFANEIQTYWIGDVDKDGIDEIVVLDDDSWLYLLDHSLNLIWKQKILVYVDRVFIGNISYQHGVIVLWCYNKNRILVYNYTGLYITERNFSDPIVGVNNIWGYLAIIVNSSDYDLYLWDPITDYIDPLAASDTYPIFYQNEVYSVTPLGLDRLYGSGPGQFQHYDIINNEPDWWLTAKEETRAFDIDSDGAPELMWWNDTYVFLIKILNDTHAELRISAITFDDISMLPGYIITVKDSVVYFYDEYLTQVGFLDTYGCGKLSGYTVLGAMCYGKRGEFYYIYNPVVYSREYVNAGWNYSIWSDHLVMYNAYVVEEYYVDNFYRYVSTKWIRCVHASTGGFTVIYNDEIAVYYMGTEVLTYSISLNNTIYADYSNDNNKAYILLENLTMITITPSGFSKWTPTLSGTVKPIMLRYISGHIYYLIVNVEQPNQNITAMMLVYRDSSVYYNLTYVYENAQIKFYTASMCFHDYDFDGIYEMATAFYVTTKKQGSDIHYNKYGITINDTDGSFYYENVKTAWEIGYKEELYKYGVSPLYNSFIFLEPVDNFIRIFSDGTNETIDLDGRETWASNGVILSSEETRFINLKGQTSLTMNNEYTARAVANYSIYSKAIILSNERKIYNYTVTEDISAPTITIDQPNQDEELNTSRIIVTWTSYDDLEIDSEKIRLDDGEWIDVTGLSTYTFYNVSEGNHTIWINATDIVGRTTSTSRSFSVDIPIDLSVYSEENNTWVSSGYVNIEYLSYGPVDNITILANNTEVYFNNTDLNGSATIFLDDGYWILSIVAKGNIYDTIIRHIYVYMDTTPPNIEILSPENNTILEYNGTMIVEVSIYYYDKFGIDHIEYSLNGSDWINIGLTDIVYVSFTTEGYYEITFRAIDHAGNTNTTKLIFAVDAEATFNISCQYDNIWTNNTSFQFSWSSTHIDYVSLYINGELIEVMPSKGIKTLTLSEGIWNITLIAMGFNDKIVETIWAKIDLTPPSIEVLEPKNNTQLSTQEDYIEVQLSLNVTDNVMVDRILIQYKNYTINASENTRIILGIGNYTLRIMAYDSAGNMDSVRLYLSIVKTETASLNITGPINQTTIKVSEEEPYGTIAIVALIGIITIIAIIKRKTIVDKIKRIL